MINKTIWKACNDVNGVRHVVLSCQMMYSGWWFTNCIICTLLTRAKALQQSIWLCLHRVFKFPTSINKILIIFSISTNHRQHVTAQGITISINSRLTILITVWMQCTYIFHHKNLLRVGVYIIPGNTCIHKSPHTFLCLLCVCVLIRLNVLANQNLHFSGTQIMTKCWRALAWFWRVHNMLSIDHSNIQKSTN